MRFTRIEVHLQGVDLHCNNNSDRGFGRGRGQGQDRGHYKTNQGIQSSKN